MAAAASNSKQVLPEEWIDFLKSHRYKKNIRNFEEAYRYVPNHMDEFPTQDGWRLDRTKPHSDFLIIIPNPSNIQQFYGIMYSALTSAIYGAIPQSFVLTYNPGAQTLTYQGMIYGLYGSDNVGMPHPIPTPIRGGVTVTISELLEKINSTKQLGGHRRRSRKAKKNKALSPQ